ncbi:MAG TPA: regulatory protein RecX [Longimicrobium sp.]|nr:regulatory protein RecX [Longimicrobium sp.]
MRITRIETQQHDRERVSIHVDGAFRLGLAAEIAHAAHLRAGVELTEARLAELERADRAWQARQAALDLLGYRQRSAAELVRRLRRKGFDLDVARETVERLRGLGMVDDAAFAGAVARDRVRLRPQGARRMREELRAKGVDEDTARAAIAGALESEETSELELARRAAGKWKPQPGEDPLRARRRLHGYLMRRGFDGECVRQVMDEVLGEGEEGVD